MSTKQLLHHFSASNLLSFGAEGFSIGLQPLNVLIGPNASGKSNFISAIDLLRGSATNMGAVVYAGGGVDEWLYKGRQQHHFATFAAEVNQLDTDARIRHSVSFEQYQQRMRIVNEMIEPVSHAAAPEAPDFYYQNLGTDPVLSIRDTDNASVPGTTTRKAWKNWPLQHYVQSDLSILSQRGDPDFYPELAYLAAQYQKIKIYRSFDLDSLNSLRGAQRPDMPSDFLEENGRNLSMVLNDLEHRGEKNPIVEKMRAVYEEVQNITVKVSGNTVQTFIHESGLQSPIPASRLSDGTLRYLCLLVILFHPSPPPLICIEEPEIGLHPDTIINLAEMLIEASHRTQLIVTTHSDLLVSALGGMPEAIIVCERAGNGTKMKRLDAERLNKWLDDYTLGELWRSGEIGGVRY